MSPEDFDLLKDCHKVLDDFSRSNRNELEGMEMSSLIVLLDMIKSEMF